MSIYVSFYGINLLCGSYKERSPTLREEISSNPSICSFQEESKDVSESNKTFDLREVISKRLREFRENIYEK